MMWARHRQHLYPEAGHTAGVRTFVFIRCLSVWRQDLMSATVKARMCLVMSKWDVQYSEKRAAATIKFTAKVGNLKFQVKEDKMLIFHLFGSCRHVTEAPLKPVMSVMLNLLIQIEKLFVRLQKWRGSGCNLWPALAWAEPARALASLRLNSRVTAGIMKADNLFLLHFHPQGHYHPRRRCLD